MEDQLQLDQLQLGGSGLVDEGLKLEGAELEAWLRRWFRGLAEVAGIAGVAEDAEEVAARVAEGVAEGVAVRLVEASEELGEEVAEPRQILEQPSWEAPSPEADQQPSPQSAAETAHPSSQELNKISDIPWTFMPTHPASSDDSTAPSANTTHTAPSSRHDDNSHTPTTSSIRAAREE